DGVAVALAGLAQVGGEVLDTARVDGLRRAVRLEFGDPAGGARRGLQVAVQVVERQELDLLVAAVVVAVRPVLAAVVLARGCRPGQGRGGQRTGGEHTGGGREETVRTASAARIVRRGIG